MLRTQNWARLVTLVRENDEQCGKVGLKKGLDSRPPNRASAPPREFSLPRLSDADVGVALVVSEADRRRVDLPPNSSKNPPGNSLNYGLVAAANSGYSGPTVSYCAIIRIFRFYLRRSRQV